MYTKARNESVRKWLTTHSLIMHTRLCKAIGYDRQNFAHFINDERDLPEQYLIKLEKLLKDYGYKP